MKQGAATQGFPYNHEFVHCKQKALERNEDRAGQHCNSTKHTRFERLKPYNIRCFPTKNHSTSSFLLQKHPLSPLFPCNNQCFGVFPQTFPHSTNPQPTTERTLPRKYFRVGNAALMLTLHEALGDRFTVVLEELMGGRVGAWMELFGCFEDLFGRFSCFQMVFPLALFFF